MSECKQCGKSIDRVLLSTEKGQVVDKSKNGFMLSLKNDFQKTPFVPSYIYEIFEIVKL